MIEYNQVAYLKIAWIIFISQLSTTGPHRVQSDFSRTGRLV